MPYTMKNTCKGCKALDWGYESYSCKLNFKMQTIRQLDGTLSNTPMEPCPKPLTFNDYYQIIQAKENIIMINDLVAKIKEMPGRE